MKAKRPFKVNKFIFLVILGSLGVLSMGASSWLIINEQSGSPIFQSKNQITASITISGTAYEGMGGLKIKSNVPGRLFYKNANGETVYLSHEVSTAQAESQTEVAILNAPINVSGSAKAISVTLSLEPYSTWLNQNQVVNPTELEKTATVKGVALIDTTYYSNIDLAIDNATSGKTVIIYETFANYCTFTDGTANATLLENYKSLPALTVRIDQEIISGVTLVVPCADITTTESPDGIDGNTDLQHVKQFNSSVYKLANESKRANNNPVTNLHANITIANNVKIKNYGTILIGGVISGGGAHSSINSMTVGKYGQLTMGSSAKLYNYSTGKIECYGYIDEKNSDNGSELIMEAGTLYTMYSVIEHHGGSALLGMINPQDSSVQSALSEAALAGASMGGSSNKEGSFTPTTVLTSPFNRFFLEGIICKITVKASATVNGFCDLYADGGENCAIISLVSSSNASVIQLTNANSIVETKFDKSTRVHNLQVFGDMQLNPFSMSLKISKSKSVSFITVTSNIRVNLSSDYFYFPVSNYWNISLNKFKSGDSATVDLTKQKIKFLPGSILNIDEGVAVNADRVAIYENNETLKSVYGAAAELEYQNNQPAQVNVYGTLIAKLLGGKVKACGLEGKLQVTESNTLVSAEVKNRLTGQTFELEILGVGFSVGYTGIECTSDSMTAQGDIYKSDLTDLAVTTYYSIPEDGGYSWVAHDNSFAINYVLNNDVAVNKPENLSSFTPESPRFDLQKLDNIEKTRFGGWYLDSSLTKQIFYIDSSAMQYVVDNTLTLYAKWSESHEITFVGGKVDLTGIGNVDFADENGFYNPYNTTQPKVMDMTPILTASTDNLGIDYYWDGNWYFDAECTRMIPKDGYTFTGDTAIYAGWADKINVTFDYDSGYDFTNGILGSLSATIYLNPEQAQSYNIANYTTAVSSKDEDTGVAQYFNGWLVENATLTSDTLTANINATTVTLTADWVDKYALTVIAQSNATAGDKININETVYLLENQLANEFTAYTNKAKGEDEDGKTNKYFGKWLDESSQEVSALTANSFGNDKQLTITATWPDKVSITIKIVNVGDNSDGRTNVTYNLYGTEDPNNESIKYYLDKYDSYDPTERKVYIIPNHYAYIELTSSESTENLNDLKNGEWVMIKGNITDEIGCDNVNKTCVAAGTLVMLADGTQKKIEDVLENDILLVFNHETGEYVPANILFLERGEWNYYNVINLEFSNGTTTKLIYEHALFDLTLNKYVYITESNYGDFVGHEFALASENKQGYEKVTLSNAYIAKEYTAPYSITSLYHYNFFIDGLFSIPGAIDGLFNIFEYGEGLKYDEEQMQADIEKYGLYGYEYYSDYMTYEMYEYWFPAKYYSVAVGKGHITYEQIIALFEYYFESFLPE